MLLEQLPNIITLVRISLIPLFVALLLYHHYEYALYVFIFAGLSDTLDGYLARKLKSHTELGKLLDPIADKFLLITSFIVYMYIGWIPIWFTVTVLSRDLFIVIGWILRYLIFNTKKVQPTRFGKYAIAMQMILVGYILLEKIMVFESFVYHAMIWMTLVLTVISGLQYIYKGLSYSDE